jgi:hypothetical protein
MDQRVSHSRLFQPRFSGFFILLLMAALISGCAGAQGGLSTSTVDPGVVTMETTAAPPEVFLPTSPAKTIPSETAIPASTPTAGLVQSATLPDSSGAALILSPGNSSRIVSPLSPKIMVRVHPEGIVHIDLVGKRDLLYARHVLDLHEKSGQEVLLQPGMPFETVNINEPARLVVRLLDGDGRTIALTSTGLTLLSSGKSEIQPSSAGGWIDIISPLEGEVVNGKKVEIIASVSPINEQPIVAELITEAGTAINTRLMKLPEGTKPGETVQLDFTLPYAVSSSTPCLLTLYQASYNQIEGTLMLVSIPVTLMP